MLFITIMTKAQKNPESRWFGFKEVPEGEKAGMVRGVFDSVAEYDDLMNDLMCAGVHRIW